MTAPPGEPGPPGAASPLAAVLVSLALEPRPEVLDRLEQYLDLLERWNTTYNLTAVRSRADMIRQHLADCLAVIRPLERWRPGGGTLLDVGSGGGLPGVVIAALLPGWEVTCVDAVGKKAAFIRQAAGQLRLSNLRALHGRVESLPPAESFDVVTARAFATLNDLVQVTRGRLRPGGAWMAMKGRRPDDEIAALPAAAAEVFHVEPLEVPGLGAERCLVWLREPATEA